MHKTEDNGYATRVRAKLSAKKTVTWSESRSASKDMDCLVAWAPEGGVAYPKGPRANGL